MNSLIPRPRFTVTFDPEFQPEKPGLYYFVNAAPTAANKENAEVGIAEMLDALYVSGTVPADRLQRIVYHPANEGCRGRVRSRGVNYVGPTTGSQMLYVVEGSEVVTPSARIYIPTLLLIGATLRAVNLEFAERIDRDDTQKVISRLAIAVSSVQSIAQRLGAERVTWDYTDKHEGVISIQPCLVNRSVQGQAYNFLRFTVTENGWLAFDLSASQRETIGSVFDWNDLMGTSVKPAQSLQLVPSIQIAQPQQDVWLKVSADLDVVLFNEALMQQQAVDDVVNVPARAGVGVVNMFRSVLRSTLTALEKALSAPIGATIEESTHAQVRRETDRLRNLLSGPITVNEGDAQVEEDNDPIIGVAVKQGDLVIALPKPYRHCDCMRYAVETLGLTAPIGQPAPHQGFYTASGRFLNRQEALKHVKRIGQPLVNPEARRYLFSEDLW